MLSPSDAGRGGVKGKQPSPPASGSSDSPTIGPPDEDIDAAQDVLAAIKARDPSSFAESLRAFINMG